MGDGSFWIVNDATLENVGLVEAPWAVDAKGKQLATQYQVLADGTVRQNVDVKGATFPVVADPRVSFGTWAGVVPVAYITYSRSETSTVAYNAAIGAPMGPIVCKALVKPVAGACTAIVAMFTADLIYTAIQANSQKRCLKLRIPMSPTAATIFAYDAYHIPC